MHITFSESAALGTWVGMVSEIHRRGTSPVKELCFFRWVRTFGTTDREPKIWTHGTLLQPRNTASKEKPSKDDLGKQILGETIDQMHSTFKENSIFHWIGLRENRNRKP